MGEDGKLDVALTKHLFDEAERFGLDSKLLVGIRFPGPKGERTNGQCLPRAFGRSVFQAPRWDCGDRGRS